MGSELVSVMMPAYNAERYIRQAVESVVAQSYSNWELIVVNDGSTDRTGEILAGFSDPRIRIYHQPNRGEACARNTALEMVRGEFLAFLDADDLHLPQHLELTAGYLKEHSGVGGVYTDGFYIDQEGARLRPLSARRRGPFEGDIFDEVMRSSDVFGAPVCVVLRTALIRQYSLRFDPEIVIGPDWDFLTQFAEVASFGYHPDSTCLYRVHQTNISVRTALDKRLHSLALCREKAIHMKRFAECSVESKTFVFYDLLINLLRSNTLRMDEVVQWFEFAELPQENQARLLRLMASKSLMDGEKGTIVAGWLRRARGLDPKDITGGLLSAIYAIHPNLCRLLVLLKTWLVPDRKPIQPFADLFER